MSARPRPVTATFKPASMQRPVDVRPRAYSLSSGGSTDSLVSVLDHCTVDELQDSEDEIQPRQVAIEEEKRQHARKRQVKRHRPHKPPSDMGSRTDLNNHTFVKLGSNGGGEGDQSTDEHNLSCWEVWLIEKAKEGRQRLKREARIKRRHMEEQRKKKQEEDIKKKKGEEKYQEWLKEYNQKTKRSNKQKEKEEKVKEELVEEKKKDEEQKAQKKYEEWLKKKQEGDKVNKQKAKKKQEQEKEEKDKLDKSSKQAYDDWLERAKQRPRSAQHSFGYTAGKLTGYYDNSALPQPHYYNPIPWQPIEVPNQKKPNKKPRSKSAYRWNPNKYL